MDINSILLQVLAIIGLIRVIFVPLIFAINKAIELSPDDRDDRKWQKIKDSWGFILLQVLLDYGAGTKIKIEEDQTK